ncbi:glucosamine-6-phosphate deaminase [Swaminathania salitolerans]|uniref:Glucosamine-6-phosphate deaminase n=1 Tax=Swaminathania salitolerans TaxID=182838 RepID=A0A511BLJ4_9PROT|nr:glucosamine-6-phosphate deaminase [Swaminathania salitolerans]GBQ10200.1 6-phosphogluconolactonase [Swaminathania salitolerans LMG 21291]GEL01206.1 glucosamine-6-phosphate deaminase [Swaminathania salitolerans]
MHMPSMHLIVTDTREEAVNRAAGFIAGLVAQRGDPVLGLATGRTMEDVYRALVARHEQEGLDFSGVTSFNLDEYVGLGPEDVRSYHHYMRSLLFDRVGMPSSHTHLPDGTAHDPDAECAAYEKAIREAGGIDLQLLGIGDTGHIGFNEPPSPFDSRTRCVRLDRQTREQNAAMFGNDPDAVPDRALTMGVGTILEADSLLMLALGSAKAEIVARALEGPVGPEISASAIRLHPRCTVILDARSASALSPQLRAAHA